MSPNLMGVLVAVVWIGLGLGAAYFILNRTNLLNGMPMNFGLTAGDLRNNFKILAVISLIAAAVIGWIGGPVLFGDQ